MASGTITLTRSGSGELYGQILWSSVSNGTAANTSTVTATIQLKRPAGWYTQGTWKGSLKVGSTTKTISYHTTVRDSWVTIDKLTATVTHNADGSGSCYIYGLLNGPTETSMEGTSVSGAQTVALDRIPRFATLLSASDFHDEENPVITYSNPAGSSVTTLEACISLDGSNADIAYRSISKTGSSYTFSLTEAERNVLRAATTGANSRTVKFCIRTEIGSSADTSSLAKTFTIKDPAPTIAPAIKDSNSTTVALTGDSSKLIRYYSNAAITIGAAAVKQASLTSKKVTCGNKSLTSDGTIQGVESGSFVFTATDSRGNNTTKTVTVPFVDYVKLTCSLSNKIPDANGNMTVTATGNFFNGSFGAKSNSLQAYFRYKPYGGTYSGWTAMTVSLSGNSYSAAADVTGLNYQTAYVFQVYTQDALATVYSGEKTVKATPVFDWGETDFRFNVPVYDQTGALIGNSQEEWQNPPLVYGVEYQTRERMNGQPVYAKAVDVGTLPSASYKEVYISGGITGIVRLDGYGYWSNTSYSYLDKVPITTFRSTLDITMYGNSRLRFTASSDLSNWSASVVVYYTKS